MWHHKSESSGPGIRELRPATVGLGRAEVTHVMSRCLLFAAVVAAQPTLAAAEEAPASTASAASTSKVPPIAVGVNAPWGWFWGTVGVSVSVGLDEHQALRANVARFKVDNSFALVTAIASELYSSDPVGTIYDAGASWVYYDRGLWDGFFLEIGVLRRDRDTQYWPEMSPKTLTDTVTYSGRAMVGWSWRLGSHAFIAAAVGGSFGRESGVETINDSDRYPETTVTNEVDRMQADLETYIRVGATFGK